MARIGNNPVPFSEDVTVSVDDTNTVTVEGPKGALTEQIDPELTVEVANDHVRVRRPTDQKRHRTVHGLSRSLIENMVEGVTDGYKKELKIIGVGYRAQMSNGALEVALGYSHPIFFLPPSDVAVSVDSDRGQDDIITVEGVDKELVERRRRANTLPGLRFHSKSSNAQRSCQREKKKRSNADNEFTIASERPCLGPRCAPACRCIGRTSTSTRS